MWRSRMVTSNRGRRQDFEEWGYMIMIVGRGGRGLDWDFPLPRETQKFLRVSHF